MSEANTEDLFATTTARGGQGPTGFRAGLWNFAPSNHNRILPHDPIVFI